MNDLVSVIVVSYNSEKTIIETLDSILMQTYKNIEIVVSDDKSSDRTISIVKEWMQKNGSAVKTKIVESINNTGIPGNVNRGIRACSGNLIKLIAADDLLMPDAIKQYLVFYHKNIKTNIYVSKVELFGEVTNSYIEYCKNAYEFMQGDNQYRKMLISNFMIAPSVGILNKKTIEEMGMFDERFPAFEDYPFYLKLLRHGYKYVLIDEPLVQYRISDNSVSNGMSKRYMKSMSSFFFREKLTMLLKERMLFVAAKQIIRYGYMYIKAR